MTMTMNMKSVSNVMETSSLLAFLVHLVFGMVLTACRGTSCEAYGYNAHPTVFVFNFTDLANISISISIPIPIPVPISFLLSGTCC
jgi:hypothetical protein